MMPVWLWGRPVDEVMNDTGLSAEEIRPLLYRAGLRVQLGRNSQ
jgi:hypothetical protein